MKTKIISIVVMLLMACNVMAQDYMRVYFKDGTSQKIYLKDITSIATKKLDADGIQHSDYEYQYITTHHNKYVYNLNEVDSITFSKFKEEEVINNLTNDLPEIFELLSDCENTNDAKFILRQIKDFQGVENAWIENVTLYVSFIGWETMGFSFSHEIENDENDEAPTQYINKANSMLHKIEAVVRPDGKKLKAVIANQQHYDERCKKYKDNYYRLKNQFESCDISTEYIDKPGLSFFSKDIYDFDLIFLVTHGNYSSKTNTHHLVTGEELFVVPKDYNILDGRTEMKKIVEELLKGFKLPYPESTDDHIRGNWVEEKRDGVMCWVYRPIISEKFIEKYAEGKFNNPYSILFNTACQSVENNSSLAVKFLDKGLGFYLGYNGINWVGKNAGPKLFESMLSGISFNRAYNILPEEYKRQLDDHDYLHYVKLSYFKNPLVSNYENIFLFKQHTKQIDQNVVIEQYRKDKTVDIEGVTKTIQPDSISYGFIFWNTQNLYRLGSVEASEKELLPNEEVLFRAKLTDLHPGNSYRYYAYSYDGTNDLYLSGLNRGDTISIEIPFDLACPDNNHPHMIDLGLPSGTKWACCNVGTTSINSKGNHYAWGELEDTGQFDLLDYEYYTWDELYDDEGNVVYRYNFRYIYIGNDIAGTKYDVAHVEWRGSWRMPSKEQCEELVNKCQWEWNNGNQKRGMLVIGPNHNMIFLPGTSFGSTSGSYWSSSLGAEDYSAYCLEFDQHSHVGVAPSARHQGFSIRPVHP